MTLLSTVISQCPGQGLAQKRCPVGHEVVAIAMLVFLGQQLAETEAGKSHACGSGPRGLLRQSPSLRLLLPPTLGLLG